jgi:hypothetical protein
MVFAITGIIFPKYYIQHPVELVFYSPMASGRLGKLNGIGEARKEIPALNGSNFFDRPGGTDTAETLQPRPVFPALKP